MGGPFQDPSSADRDEKSSLRPIAACHKSPALPTLQSTISPLTVPYAIFGFLNTTHHCTIRIHCYRTPCAYKPSLAPSLRFRATPPVPLITGTIPRDRLPETANPVRFYMYNYAISLIFPHATSCYSILPAYSAALAAIDRPLRRLSSISAFNTRLL